MTAELNKTLRGLGCGGDVARRRLPAPDAIREELVREMMAEVGEHWIEVIPSARAKIDIHFHRAELPPYLLNPATEQHAESEAHP